MRRNRSSSTSFTARRSAAHVALLWGAMMLAGCTSDGSGFDWAKLGGDGSQVFSRPTPPSVSMAGRWMLASPGRGQCTMNFGAAAPHAAEGTIAPEGGCPDQFYTSRKWTHDTNGLVIRNHRGEPLAQLSAGGGRFAGQTPGGEAVTLTR